MNSSTWKLDYDFKQIQNKFFQSASKLAEDFNLDRLQEDEVERGASPHDVESDHEVKLPREVTHHNTVPNEIAHMIEPFTANGLMHEQHDELEDLSFNDLLAEPEHVVRAATPPSVAASTSPSSTIADTTAAPAPPPTPPESVSAPSPGATTASQRWTAPTASYFFDDDISPEQDPIMQRLAARKLHSDVSSSGLSSSFASAATSLKSSFSGVTRKLFRSASPPASPALTSITTTPPRSATRKALPAPQVAYSTRALPAPQGAYSTRVAAPSLSIMPMLRSMLLKVWDNLGSNNALVLLSLLLLWSTYYKFGRHATETGDN